MQGIVDAHAEPLVDEEEIHAALSRKLEEGGQFGYYQTITRRYGIVPERAMPPTHATEDSEILFRDIKDALARFGMEVATLRRLNATAAGRLTPPRQFRFQRALGEVRTRAVESIYRILALHLGTPPTSVVHQGERLSPLQYMRQVLSFNPSDYVAVSFYPTEEVGTQAFRIRDLSADGTPAERAIYLNVSPTRYMELINGSLTEGYPVLAGVDTAGPMDDELGILHALHRDTSRIYGPLPRKARRLNRHQRILTGSQGTGHVMVLVGYDESSSDGTIVKYKAQNSWGADSADRGYFHMYRSWLEIYGRDAIIHRSLLSAEELAALENPVESRAFDRLVE
jgi:bleomycin hydrolase